MAEAANSALYSARLRFAEGLPARARELSGVTERLARDPEDAEALILLRRRLHALLASAQVFEESALALAVQDLIARLEQAQRERRPLSGEEIDAVGVVVASLPTYLRPSVAPPPAQSDVRELLPVPPTEAEAAQLPAAELPDGDYTPPVLFAAVDLRPPTQLPPLDVELPPSDAERAAIAELDRALGIEPVTSAPAGDDRPTLASAPRVVLTLVEADARPEPDATIDWTEVVGVSSAAPPQATAAPDDERTDPGLGPRVLLEQTVSGLSPAPRSAIVLVVGRAAPLPTLPNVEFVSAASADEAVRLLHDVGPDLVLVSAEIARQPGLDLVRRLKSDPLRPAARVHVLLDADAAADTDLASDLGADDALREPLDATLLEPLLAGVSERRFGLCEASMDDIASQIAEELRRGIAESLRAGQSVPAGDGSELMAAAWSAVGRVRSNLAEQKRSRTSDAPGVQPAQLLQGCRVLVADDDPAVVWFFSGLLREASASVLQAQNGREALELARRKQPHVVVSDILMPKLDGFGLCRELRRDVLLAHVPVVLLSWKDDLLQRMRELDAGAAGYLRKEAGAREILRVLGEVLEPLLQLGQQLKAAGDVRGTLQGIGPYALLEQVASLRPDAHIVVRDASNVFEVDVRGGRRLSVTRTAADGSFTRGEQALMQLLGLASGSFEISLASTPLRAALTEPLERALAAAGRRLAALIDSVSDARLLRVSLLAFDDDVLAPWLAEPNPRLHEVVARFRAGGDTAESLLREGRITPGELEADLRELARGLAISGVWDAAGEDLVAAAQRERELPQLAPPISGAPAADERAERAERPTPVMGIDPVSAGAQPEEPVFFAEVGKAERARGSDGAWPARAADTAGGHAGARDSGSALPVGVIGPASDVLGSRTDDTPLGGARASEPPPSAAGATGTLPLFSEPPAALVPPPVFVRPAEAVAAAQETTLHVPLSEPGRERAEGLRLLGTLLVLAAFGYFGWQQLGLRKPDGLRPAAVETSSEAVSTPPESSAKAQEPALPNTQVGRVLPFVDNTRGVRVAAEEGLLVLEYQGSEPAPSVRVGERDLGRPPLAVALPAGRHELVVRAGKSTSFRYLILRAGETRVVTLPLAEL